MKHKKSLDEEYKQLSQNSNDIQLKFEKQIIKIQNEYKTQQQLSEIETQLESKKQTIDNTMNIKQNIELQIQELIKEIKEIEFQQREARALKTKKLRFPCKLSDMYYLVQIKSPANGVYLTMLSLMLLADISDTTWTDINKNLISNFKRFTSIKYQNIKQEAVLKIQQLRQQYEIKSDNSELGVISKLYKWIGQAIIKYNFCMSIEQLQFEMDEKEYNLQQSRNQIIQLNEEIRLTKLSLPALTAKQRIMNEKLEKIKSLKHIHQCYEQQISSIPESIYHNKRLFEFYQKYGQLAFELRALQVSFNFTHLEWRTCFLQSLKNICITTYTQTCALYKEQIDIFAIQIVNQDITQIPNHNDLAQLLIKLQILYYIVTTNQIQLNNVGMEALHQKELQEAFKILEKSYRIRERIKYLQNDSNAKLLVEAIRELWLTQVIEESFQDEKMSVGWINFHYQNVQIKQSINDQIERLNCDGY